MLKNKYITLPAIVSEMSSEDDFKISVPHSKGVNVEELTKGDNDPMFVVVEALNEGQSKNGRMYDLETLKTIEQQINDNKPDAYEGHLKDDERPYKRPVSKTVWIGAKIVNVDGKNRLFVKGYVMPYAKELKDYLRVAKAIGKRVAVSIYGQAKEVLDRVNNIKKITEFQLESIDWSRSMSEGIPTLGYLAVTREMEDEELEQRDWQAVIETYNNMRNEVITSISEQYKSKDLHTISEMLSVKESAVITTIREMQDNVAKLEKEVADALIDKTLTEQVGNNKAEKFVKELIVAEMEKGAYNKQRAITVIETVLNRQVVKEMLGELSRKLEINPPVYLESDETPTRKYTDIK